MRNTHLKLPIVFTIAVIVLATGWSAAGAWTRNGYASQVVGSSVSKALPADGVASGEPDTPGAHGSGTGSGSNSGTGTGKASCHPDDHSGIRGMTSAGRMWATLFLIRYFAL